jgi:hypothetical protein
MRARPPVNFLQVTTVIAGRLVGHSLALGAAREASQSAMSFLLCSAANHRPARSVALLGAATFGLTDAHSATQAGVQRDSLLG